LAIVRRILEDHGGRLILGDRPPTVDGPVAGARIILSFPLRGESRAETQQEDEVVQVKA